MRTYDQTHYMWANEQLTEASGWGIHASSNTDSHFLADAESFSKGHKPEHDEFTGESLIYDQNRNCFLRMGVSYCSSKENDRTNRICHLLIPVNSNMQDPEDLFFPFAFDTGETAEKILTRIDLGEEPENGRYYRILEEYGFLKREKLGKLLYDFWQITQNNQKNIPVYLGSYAKSTEYQQVVMDIMWLLHTLAGDDTQLRSKLTFNLYVDGPAAGICFTDQYVEGALVLDSDFNGTISQEELVKEMFLRLAEYASAHFDSEKLYRDFVPKYFREEIKALISIGQEGKTADLKQICLQRYLEDDTDKKQKEKAFERVRSIAKERSWGNLPYQKLYFAEEARRADSLTIEQAKEDWKIMKSSFESKKLMEEYADYIYELITVIKKENLYKDVEDMIAELRNKSKNSYVKIMEKDCEKAVSERLIFWHVKELSYINGYEKWSKLKEIPKLYSPSVVSRNFQEEEFIDLLIEELKEIYRDLPSDKKEISAYVIDELVPLCGEHPVLDYEWRWFIEEDVRKKLEENGFSVCIERMDILDPYAAYPICMEALSLMENSLKNHQKPAGNLTLPQIQKWFDQSRTIDPNRKKKYEEAIHRVKEAEAEKEKYDKREEIKYLSSLEQVLEKYDKRAEKNISKNWCDQLLYCIDQQRIDNPSLEKVKEHIEKSAGIREDFKKRFDDDWEECAEKMKTAVRKMIFWLTPDSKVVKGSRVEIINTYEWCEHLLAEIGDENSTFYSVFLESFQESDFSYLLKQADFGNQDQMKKILYFRIYYENNCEKNHRLGNQYHFYMEQNRNADFRRWLKNYAYIETDSKIIESIRLMEDRFCACELFERLKDERANLPIDVMKIVWDFLLAVIELGQNNDNAVIDYLKTQIENVQADSKNQTGCSEIIMTGTEKILTPEKEVNVENRTPDDSYEEKSETAHTSRQTDTTWKDKCGSHMMDTVQEVNSEFDNFNSKKSEKDFTEEQIGLPAEEQSWSDVEKQIGSNVEKQDLPDTKEQDLPETEKQSKPASEVSSRNSDLQDYQTKPAENAAIENVTSARYDF